MATNQYSPENLTNTKTLEEAILRFDAIYNSISIGIGINDKNGTLVDCNSVLLKIYGIENKQEWLNSRICFAKDPNFSASIIDQLKSGKNENSIVFYNFDKIKESGFYKTTNKGNKVIEIRTSNLTNSNNEHLGYVMTSIDVTDSRLQEMIQRTIYDNIPVGVELYNKNGELLYLNPFDMKIFGVENANDVLGINLFDNPNIPDHIKDRTRAGENFNYELEYNFSKINQKYYKTYKIENRYLSLKNIAIRNDHNEVEGYMLTNTDVTEQRTRQQLLENTQRELELALKTGDISTWKYEINKQLFTPIMGRAIPKDGILLEDALLAIHPDDKALLLSSLENLASTKIDDTEAILRFFNKRYNQYRYYENRMATRIDKNGNRNYITGTQRDITNDITQKRQLEEFKIKTELTNEKNHIIQWDYDPAEQCIITQGNGAIEEGVAMNKEIYSKYVHPEDLQIVSNTLDQMSCVELNSFDITIRVTLPNYDHYRYIVLNGLALKDKEGKITSYTGIRRDVTEETLQRKELAEKTYKTALVTKASGFMPWEYDCQKKIFISEDNDITGKDMTIDDYIEMTDVQDRERLLSTWNIMLEGEDKSYSIDIKYELNDQIKYATIAGEPYERDANGKVTRYLGYRNDTTDFVLMNKDIQESKFKTDMAIKNANMVMWEYSVEERMFIAFNDPLTNYNPKAKYSPADYISNLDYNSTDDAIEIIAMMDRGELGYFSFKSKIMLPNSKEWKYVTIHGVHSEVQKNNPSKATKYIGFRVDNSELVRLTQGLKESNELTTSILAQSPSAIFIKDISDNWKYIIANNLFCQLFNYTEDKIIGYSDYEVFSESIADKFREDDIKAIQYGGIYSFIEEVVSEGKVQALHTTKRVITTQNGRQLLIGISSDISATIAQQKALEEANEKCELVLNNANAGLVYINNDFRIIWENTESMTNNIHINKYKRGGICYECVHGLNEPCANCVITRVKISRNTEKETKIFEDGIVIDIYATPVMGSNKEISGFVCRLDDVTEAYKQQSALEDSNERLTMALDVIQAFSWHCDMRDEILHFDNSFTLLGYDMESMNSMYKYAQHIHIDHRQEFLNLMADFAKRDGGEFISTYLIDLRNNGNYEWYECRGKMKISCKNGQTYKYIYGMDCNVTRHKKITDELTNAKNESEEASTLLQSIIKQIPLGLYIKDISNDFRYVIMNDVLANLVLVDSKDAIGKSDYELFSKKIADVFYNESITAANRPEGELTVIKSKIDWHGQESVYENYDTSITVAGRRLLIGVVADVTGKEHMLNELKEAKEHAEQSDKLKSAFLANMSHEIRTPLNAIVGFSELLIEAESLEEREEYTNIISENNELLLRLIGDILDLSKIESGMIELRTEKFDLSDVCDEVYTMLKQKISNPDITFNVENPYQHCIVELDKNRLKQVGINFITNAIKYTAKGRIKMGYHYVNNGIKIYVEDTGIGISKENYNKVFKRFEKFDSFAQGTGLGLSICKAIMNAQGGEINFESEEGKGSTFWAWFPCSAEIEEIDSTEVDNQITVSNGNTTGQSTENNNLKILIAEDNDSNFLLIKHMLKNYNITRAFNGLEAVLKAKTDNFDIILMDWKMPIMTGLEATLQIRVFNKEIPIIAVTANAFDSERMSIIEAGCNDFVSKPLKKKELTDAIEKYKN